jgi:hypothetical protein
MKAIFLTTIVATMLSLSTSAQLSENTNGKGAKQYAEPSGHAIGAVLSSSNGKGLAYRYWKNRLGVHASFLPYTTDNTMFLNGGLTGYCAVRKYDIGSLFFHAGMEYQYERDDLKDYFSSQMGTIEYREETRGLNFGFGPGLHVMQNFISVDLFVGYGFYSRDRSSSLSTADPKDSFTTNVSGGVAVFIEL